VYTCRPRPRADTTLRLGVQNAMFLTPRHGNLSQGCITISVPLFSHAVRVNLVFELDNQVFCSGPFAPLGGSCVD
jgi:hypothetical protein